MNLSSSSVGSSEFVRAEVFESSLHSRILGRAGATDAATWRLIYVEQGRADLLDDAEPFPLIAPCVMWQPWPRDMRARIGAGAVGAHITVGAGILANAIGHKPESPELRFMADRRAYVSLAAEPNVTRNIAQSIATIVTESAQEKAAARTVIEMALRMILINIWRAQDAPQDGARPGSITLRLVGQFHNLVEVHFRERWSVHKYAGMLGITTDRLNDMCKRARRRTPRQIIASRVGVEARLLLENSLHSLDQIANQLGFPSTAQFNRFFKSIHGVPPGQYRRQQLHRVSRSQEQERGALYEWP